jgi:hypothetical protein
MSDELQDLVSERTGSSRRKFLMGLLAGSAFAAPFVASFSMGGASGLSRVNSLLLAGNQGGSNDDCEQIPATVIAGGNTSGSNCDFPESR